jgi:quinohemoprotein ethanol dehydrogenase
MRRLMFLVVATGAIAAVTVALASASHSTATSKAAATPTEATPSYLPQGVAPCETDWPAPGCDIANTAYSNMTQLNTSNVGGLKEVWRNSFNGTLGGSIESQPLEVSGKGKNLPDEVGTVFQTIYTGMVALNARTGALLWKYQGPANRNNPLVTTSTGTVGTARSESFDPTDGQVFTGQQDGSVVALDAKTGSVKWTAQVSATGTYGTATGAETCPYTVYFNDGKDGLVFAGPNGGESPIRGHLDAYNAKTGALVWRQWETPDPTQLPYILTWSNPAEAAIAGATVWSIAAIDPQLGDIYFGTGNPYPYTGRQPGKDLWSDSIMGVNIKNGQLKWFYQGIHHDLWDYDCPTPPTLYNTTIRGHLVRGIAASCKSGYLYLLNRVNGVPIFPIPEVPVPDLSGGLGAQLNNTWPTQPEPIGAEAELGGPATHCPIPTIAADWFGTNWPNQTATVVNGAPVPGTGFPDKLVCPYAPAYIGYAVGWGLDWPTGGTDYPRMSFDPQTNDIYVCTHVTGILTRNASPLAFAQTVTHSGGVGRIGSVSAVNVTNNTMDWQVFYNSHQHHAQCYSGVLSTAGGLVFTASENSPTIAGDVQPTTGPGAVGYTGGEIFAYNAKTGAELWHFIGPGTIQAPPITYVSGGRQYVAIVGKRTIPDSSHLDEEMAFALCPNGTAPAATTPYYLSSFQPWTGCGNK